MKKLLYIAIMGAALSIPTAAADPLCPADTGETTIGPAGGLTPLELPSNAPVEQTIGPLQPSGDAALVTPGNDIVAGAGALPGCRE
jgi:hypothetical protein